MSDGSISIIFRALNEEKWFDQALEACKRQVYDQGEIEIILVDSGSTDSTLSIAERHGVKIVHIAQSDFTFGRSLNYGCDAAQGKYLVFISAHCIPTHENWLANLIEPLATHQAHYSYGRQVGGEKTRFSEHQVFAQYFGEKSHIPQEGFFVNNANSAITREIWSKYRFDEEVTGLEDMVLGRQLTENGMKIAYVSEAPVYHIHEETFQQTKRRYYREALTLREIMPEVQLNFADLIRYTCSAVMLDFSFALSERKFWAVFGEIIQFRFMQYWGAYKGHNENRVLSREQKEKYYFPTLR